MNATVALLASVLLVTAQPPEKPEANKATAVKVSNFVVTLIHDVRVPAREAGVIMALDAKKGQFVKKDDILGRVDDLDAQVRKVIAENELKAATAQAESDADLQAAIATIGVAKAEYEESLNIRDRARAAISEFEVRRLELTHRRSRFQADTAKVDHEVAKITRLMREAQLGAVGNEIDRRRIKSPLDGVVVDRFHNVGEWAQAGEPIYRVVHMDRLRVEGMLSAATFMPERIEGCPVIISVQTPDGVETCQAVIDFVSPVVDLSGEFLIHAEFDNPRKPSGHWTFRPGLEAEITIMLKPDVSARDAR